MRSFYATLLTALWYQTSQCGASTHTCDSESACPSTITCSPGEPCSVTCSGDLSCQSRVINCPSNRPCEVQCIDATDKRLCLGLVINATNSRSLTVNVATGESSVTKIMHNAQIYCPHNGPFSTNQGTPCTINCDGDDLLAKTEIFATGGFDDVAITSVHYDADSCYREGIMHCGDDLSSSCSMTDDSDTNTMSPTFQCLSESVDTTCNPQPSTSQVPSAYPSVSPMTSEPTAQVTPRPTSPTPRPTPRPTIARLTGTPTQVAQTAEPTSNPTTRPTASPSIAPSLDRESTMASTSTQKHMSEFDYDVTQVSSMTSTHYNARNPQSGTEFDEGSLSTAENIAISIGAIAVGGCCFALVCVGALRCWCMGCCERDTRKKSKSKPKKNTPRLKSEEAPSKCWCVGCCSRDTSKKSNSQTKTKQKDNVPRLKSAELPSQRSIFKMASLNPFCTNPIHAPKIVKIDDHPEAADDIGALSDVSESESEVSSNMMCTSHGTSEDRQMTLEFGDVGQEATELSVCVPKGPRAFRSRVAEDSVSQAEHSRSVGEQFTDGQAFAKHCASQRARANCHTRS